TSTKAGPACPGFGSKRFRKVTTWLQAQSWKGPHVTAPFRQRAAPPLRYSRGRRAHFIPASPFNQTHGGERDLLRCGWRLPEGNEIMPNKMLIDASHPEETRV